MRSSLKRTLDVARYFIGSRTLRAMMNKRLSETDTGNPYLRLIGVETVARGEGYARCRLPVEEKVQAGVAGSVHGGAISALVDIAAMQAVATLVHAGEQMAGTAELNVSYLRPAFGDAVFASAQVLRKGRTLAVCDVDIHAGDGKLVAKGRVSYALRPADLMRDT